MLDCCRQGSEWHKYRTEFGKKLMSQTEANRLVGPISDVTDDFITRLRHVRDGDGDLAVVNNLVKDAHKWSMEGRRWSMYFMAPPQLPPFYGCHAGQVELAGTPS